MSSWILNSENNENFKCNRQIISILFSNRGYDPYMRSVVFFLISSSSYVCHAVGPLVDPFRSHVSRSLFKGLA